MSNYQCPMTNNYLNIAAIQTDLVWEDTKTNLAHLGEIILNLSREIDIVVLPEMFATGFSMNVELCAETMGGVTMEWLKKLAQETGIVIAGSLMIREEELFYNRFVFMKPDGSFETYNKRHLFRMGEENLHFTAGTERKVFEYKSFRILPQVCYDLRFPVFARNRGDYDLMINCANWPAPRQHVWGILLKARAIENQAFVVGVNRIGKDANGINYAGGSVILDAKGAVLSSAEKGQQVITAKLSKQSLLNFRSRFPVSGDADLFDINI